MIVDETFTVTVPAADRSLLTTQELRDAIGAKDDRYDALLPALGEAVAGALAARCRIRRCGAIPRTFRLEALEQSFELCGTVLGLQLARRPVTMIDTVTEGGTPVDLGDIRVNATTGMLRRLINSTSSAWATGTVTVAYHAGWATVPDTLRQAAQKYARAVWFQTGPGAREPNVRRERVEGMTDFEYWIPAEGTPEISSDIVQLLRDYMNRMVA